jgi:hypothetical protein
MQKIIVSSIAVAILALSGSAAWADQPDQLNPDNPVELRHQMHDWHHRQAMHHSSWRHHHHYYHHHHIRRHHHAM